MDGSPDRKPVVPSRGVLRLEDFCAASGLDRSVVESLMREHRIPDGLWWDTAQTRAMGLFDDELPTRSALVALGLPVRESYDPRSLQSHEVPDDGEGPDVWSSDAPA